MTLALVAVVFGVHSAIDWTWFVPAVTITALFCAGWVAGRGPIGSRPPEPGPPALETARASLPRGRLLYERAALAVPVLVVAALAALAVVQPWRAEEKGSDALSLVAQGDFARAHATAEQARDINPLSPEPYFELAAVEDARGDSRAAVDLLEHAVQVEPANAEAWLRLGNYLLVTMSDPTRALPVLQGAIYLDPLSDAARNSYLLALRADRLERTRRSSARAASGQRRKSRARSAPALARRARASRVCLASGGPPARAAAAARTRTLQQLAERARGVEAQHRLQRIVVSLEREQRDQRALQPPVPWHRRPPR